MDSLTDKKIAVVGATGTIGGAVCHALATAGAHVLGAGRDPERLKRVSETCVNAVRLDLAPGAEAGPCLLAACESTFGNRLDGLVIASGAHGPIGPTRTLSPTQLAAYLDEQLISTIGLVSSAASMLDNAPAPSIVILSGGGATGPRAMYTPYALAKVATVRLVENLALEEPTWRVNAVAPGFVASAIHESTIKAGKDASGEDPTELRQRLENADAPERAAGLIAFLLSDDSAGITGRLISAPWDAWEDAPWQRALLESDALGRLRRIDGVQFDVTEHS